LVHAALPEESIPSSLRPVSRWTNRNGRSPSASMVTKNVQSATMALNTMPASYPAASMLSSFCWNGQAPRSISAIPEPAGNGSQPRPT